MSPPTPALCFADLNIQHTGSEPATLRLVQRAIQLGYDCVAINQDIGALTQAQGEQACTSTGPAPPKKKKKGKGAGAGGLKQVPAPVRLDQTKLDLTSLTAQGKRFRLYSRLTVTLDNSEHIHHLLRDANVNKYDLLAVRPVTEQCLNTLSTKGELVDLLCFEIGADIPWLYRGKLMNRAISDLGMAVELTYAPALADSSVRCTFLANARQVMANAKSVIVSSGASRVIELRGPYDAANLMALADVPRQRCRRLVSGNCARVLLRAESRQCEKGTARVQPIADCDSTQLARLAAVPAFASQLHAAKHNAAADPGVIALAS